MSKIVSPWPPAMVREADTQNNQDALAHLPATLSGDAAALYGWVSGKEHDDFLSNAANPAPIGPYGKPGHDHSGGYFGRPRFVSIASISGDPGNVYAGASTDYKANIDTLTVRTEPIDANETTTETMPIFFVDVPNCEPGIYGAYTKLDIWGVYQNITNMTRDLGDTVTLGVKNLHPDSLDEKTFDVTLTSLDTDYTFQTTAGQGLRMVPSEINPIRLWVKHETDASTGSRRAHLRVMHIELGVMSTVIDGQP